MRKQFFYFFGLISLIITTFGFIKFIKNSNDHKECDTITHSFIRNNVEIREVKHICHEKYNF